MDNTIRARITDPGMDPTERFNLGLSATLQGRPYEAVLLDVLEPLRRDRYLHGRINQLFLHAPTGELGLHSIEVGVDVASLCVEEKMEQRLVLEGFRGGALHDIGKLGVPAYMFMKQKLTPEERVVMRRHPSYSGTFIDIGYSTVAWDSAHGHHEGKTDSYPRVDNRRKYHNPVIHLDQRKMQQRVTRPENEPFVRMVRSAEVLHALKSSRSYKPAFNAGERVGAFTEIFRNDPEHMSHFTRLESIAAQCGTGN